MYVKSVMFYICIIIGICATFSSSYAKHHSKPALKLYVFDCGMLTFPTVDMFSISNDETDVRELIVPCYIIEHEKGRLLWDGGLPSSIAEHEGYDEGGQRLDKTFAEQIKPLGLTMASFDYVAFSHMHYDHVAVAKRHRVGVARFALSRRSCRTCTAPTCHVRVALVVHALVMRWRGRGGGHEQRLQGAGR